MPGQAHLLADSHTHSRPNQAEYQFEAVRTPYTSMLQLIMPPSYPRRDFDLSDWQYLLEEVHPSTLQAGLRIVPGTYDDAGPTTKCSALMDDDVELTQSPPRFDL